MPQTAWVSSSCSHLGTRCRSESQRQTEGFGPSLTHGWAVQPRWERSASMVRGTLSIYIGVCPRLQLTSHTQETSTLSRIKWERGIFLWRSEFVRSFKFVIIVDYVFTYICICIRAVVWLWVHKTSSLYLPLRGCPRGVMVKAIDCGIIVSEFVFQSRYYVHFRANTLGKDMNPLILSAMG